MCGTDEEDDVEEDPEGEDEEVEPGKRKAETEAAEAASKMQRQN